MRSLTEQLSINVHQGIYCVPCSLNPLNPTANCALAAQRGFECCIVSRSLHWALQDIALQPGNQDAVRCWEILTFHMGRTPERQHSMWMSSIYIDLQHHGWTH
jgi:hypothetical protein